MGLLRAPGCVGGITPVLVAFAALGACAWSCAAADVSVFSAVPGVDAGMDGTAASKPLPDVEAQDFCSGTGPPELVDTAADGGPTTTCPDQLAQREFRYALCTCNGYVSDQAIVTDAFDGSQGSYDASSAVAGGSIGVNGDLHPSGPMHVGGSLWATNSTVITTSSVYVAGELHTEGEMRPSADPTVMANALTVGADAWMAGGLQTTDGVTIGGALHVPQGQPVDVTGTFTHGSTDDRTQPFQPACACAPEDLVDIAGIVATYEATNDDMALGISSTALENVQSEEDLTLDCGRIFFTRIGANAPIHLTAKGRVAIFVEGDISTDDFTIDVPDGSELDLFVGGSVTVRGAFLLGEVTNPARARMYVAGPSVNLSSAATMAGNLYAPNATLVLGASAPTTLYGAIFASAVTASADLRIHYDESILAPASMPACSAPESCAASCDCAGLACNSGTCGQCSENSDCCAPLVCGPAKTCVPDVTPR